MSNAHKALLGTAASLGVVYLVWLTLKVMGSLPEGVLQSNLLGFGLFAVAVVLALPILAKRSERVRKWKRAREHRPEPAEPANSAVGATSLARVYAPDQVNSASGALALVGPESPRIDLSSSPSTPIPRTHADSLNDTTPSPVRAARPAAVEEPMDPFAVYRGEEAARASVNRLDKTPPPSGRTGSFGRVRGPFLDKTGRTGGGLEQARAAALAIGGLPQAVAAGTRPGPPAVAQRTAPKPHQGRLPAPAPAGTSHVPVAVPTEPASVSIRESTAVATPVANPVVSASPFAMNVDEHGADHIEHALEALEREIIDNGALPAILPSPEQMVAPTAQRPAKVPLDQGPATAAPSEPRPQPVPVQVSAHGDLPKFLPSSDKPVVGQPDSLADVFNQAVDRATRDLTKAAAVARLRALKTKLVPTVAEAESTRQLPMDEVMTQLEAMRKAPADVPESIHDALASTQVQAAPTLEGLLAMSVDLGLESEDASAPTSPSKAESEAPRQSFETTPFRTGVGSLDRSALNELWCDFALASEECGRNPALLRHEVFRDHVVRNHDAICRRFGVAKVAFSVKIKKGRPTLSAKPLAAQTAASQAQ